MIDHPGRYLVDLEPLDGFEPAEAREIDLRTEKSCEIELHTRRR